MDDNACKNDATAPVLDPSHELPAHAGPDGTGGGKQSSVFGWRLIVILLVVIGAVTFVVWRIKGNEANTKKEDARANALADRPTPVAVQKAMQQPIPIYLTALGTVTAYNTVTVKSRVDGQITRVNFTEGQHVKQGQLLIQIDPRPYEAALAQAKGNLARDQANASLAKAQSNRYTALYQAGVVSRESEQTQQSTAGQSVGTIAGDNAAIEAAQVNLGYTRISSPISGIVGLRQVDIGNIIAANSSSGLVVITQVQPIAVIFTLPEDQLPQVRKHMAGGQSLVVEAWDRSNTQKIATGSLLTIDNQIDTTTGTAKLKAVFQNSNEALFPNQFVNIRLVLETRQNALVIPATALQTGENNQAFVYVVDTSKQVPATSDSATAKKSSTSSNGQQRQQLPTYLVTARPVSVSLTQGTQLVISSGIKPGDLVVIDGQEKLKDKSKVQLRNQPGSKQQSGANAPDAQDGADSGGSSNTQQENSNGAPKQ